MTKHVARVLCRAASSDNRADGVCCAICDHIDNDGRLLARGECSLWPTFIREAAAAIEGVRDHARLEMRRKPRQRSAVELLQSL